MIENTGQLLAFVPTVRGTVKFHLGKFEREIPFSRSRPIDSSFPPLPKYSIPPSAETLIFASRKTAKNNFLSKLYQTEPPSSFEEKKKKKDEHRILVSNRRARIAATPTCIPFSACQGESL